MARASSHPTPDPHTPITQLKGVGPKLADTLGKLGIYRYIDLLLHLPMRYQDRTKITPLNQVRPAEECLIEGRILGTVVLFGKRRSLKVTVEDNTGHVHLRFFHFSKYQQSALDRASHIRAFGECRFFGRELTLVHPEYETFEGAPSDVDAELTPIYPSTQGLGQGRIRNLTAALCALPWTDTPGTPYSSLKILHQPPGHWSSAELESIQEAIALDEMSAYYLVMQGRAQKRQKERAIALPRSQALGRELLKILGFHLTEAQARVVSEVLTDLEKPVPMLRLVQGDVGSGKTVVAAFAAIRAAEQGCQTALMAPTELLAEQHYHNFRGLA